MFTEKKEGGPERGEGLARSAAFSLPPPPPLHCDRIVGTHSSCCFSRHHHPHPRHGPSLPFSLTHARSCCVFDSVISEAAVWRHFCFRGALCRHAMLADRTIGYVLLALSTACYLYFVIWVGVTPFIDAEHFTQSLFPPREYGLYLSAAILTCGFVVSATIGSVHSILRTGYVPRAASREASPTALQEPTTSVVEEAGSLTGAH